MCTKEVARSIASMTAATIVFFVAERAFGDGMGGHESEQGTRIFGTMDPNLEGVSIPFIPSGDAQADYESLRIDAGRLVMTRKDKTENKEVTTLTLIGFVGPKEKPVKVTLVINGARPHENIYETHDMTTGTVRERKTYDATTGTVWEYNVTYDATVPANVTPDGRLVDGKMLCDTVNNAALVVPAAWQDGQLSSSTPDTGFTFTCVPILKPRPQFKPPNSAVLAPPTALTVVQHPSPLTTSRPQASGSIHQSGVANAQSGVVNVQSGAVNIPLSAAMPRWLADDPLWHGGVAAKCIDRYYAPWASNVSALLDTVTHQPVPQPSDTEARKFHNICVHAMTADYAGDGRPRTIPGTMIALFNLTDLPVSELCLAHAGALPMQSPVAFARALPAQRTVAPAGALPAQRTVPPAGALPAQRTVAPAGALPAQRSLREILQAQYSCQPPASARILEILEQQYKDLKFEGVWREDGGVARAVCLAKPRWRTLDPNDASLKRVQLPPSRATTKPTPAPGQVWVPGGVGVPCEDLTLEDLDLLSNDKPLLISYSAINERGLYRFPNNAGGIVTTHVLPCTTPCRSAFLGNVLAPDAPRDGLGSLIPLYVYEDAKGNYATLAGAKVEQGVAPSPPHVRGYQRVDLPDDFPAESSTASSRQFKPPHLADPEGYLFAPTNRPTLPPGSNVQIPELWQTHLQENGIVSYCTFVKFPPHRSGSPSLVAHVGCENSDKNPQLLGYLLAPGVEMDLSVRHLASTPLFTARNIAAHPPGVPGPGPVETLETKGTIQQQPATTQTPTVPAATPMAAPQAPAAPPPIAMPPALGAPTPR